MGSLQIYIGDKVVDLDTKSEGKFFITKQVNDLRSLNSRNGSFTRNLTLPATTKNIEIFFKVIPGTPIIRDIWEQLKCRVLFGGVTLFYDADLFLVNYSAIKKQIEVRIVGGNSVFYDQMETKNLKDANFYDIEFDWTLGNLQAQANKTSNDYAAADQDWHIDGETAFTKSSPLRKVRMTRSMGLFLFYREIMERLVESNGYSLDITDLYSDLEMFKNVPTSDIGNNVTRMTITTADGIDVNTYATVGSVDLFVRGNDIGGDPLAGQHKYGEIVAINQMVGTATIDIRFTYADPTGTESNYYPFKVVLYNQIALSIPVTQFAGGELNEVDPFDTFSDLTSPQTINSIGTTRIIGWTVQNDSPVGSWDDVAQAFIMTKDYLRGIRFSFNSPPEGFLVSGTGNKFFNIEKNGNVVYGVAINNSGGTQNFSAFFPVDSGDRISFSIRLIQGSDSESVELVPGPHGTLNEEVTISGSSDIGIEVSLPDYLPNISQKKMFAEICKTMNLVPEINEFTKTLVLNRFDAVFELLEEINYNYIFGDVEDDVLQGNITSEFMYAELNVGTGGLPDWSKKLDLSREIKYFNFIPTWFRNNLFGWSLGTNLRRQDTTGSYPMLNEQLRDTGDKIRSIFGAMDDSTLLESGTTSFVDRVSLDPKFIMSDLTGMGETAQVNATNTDRLDLTFTVDDNPDIQIGDILIFTGGAAETDSDPRFIAAITRDGNETPTQLVVDTAFSAVTSVNTEWSVSRVEVNADAITRVCTVKRKTDITKGFPWVGNIEGAGGSTIIPAMRAHFSSNLTWGSIIGTDYAKMLAGLNSPLMVRAWFVFDPVEFTQIKMLRLVYITTLNGLFYINKIEQYKANKPVRVELIRMNAVLKAGQIALPTGGEPLEVELEGLLTK